MDKYMLSITSLNEKKDKIESTINDAQKRVSKNELQKRTKQQEVGSLKIELYSLKHIINILKNPKKYLRSLNKNFFHKLFLSCIVFLVSSFIISMGLVQFLTFNFLVLEIGTILGLLTSGIFLAGFNNEYKAKKKELKQMIKNNEYERVEKQIEDLRSKILQLKSELETIDVNIEMDKQIIAASVSLIKDIENIINKISESRAQKIDTLLTPSINIMLNGSFDANEELKNSLEHILNI